MDVNWYEFQIGLFVEAKTEDDAWQQLEKLIDLMNKIDPEGDATIEYVGMHQV